MLTISGMLISALMIKPPLILFQTSSFPGITMIAPQRRSASIKAAFAISLINPDDSFKSFFTLNADAALSNIFRISG